ncbi:MAG: replicative DNA helicase [Firmicutes bacterium]|nr:replicative DNA helicase [Bacillota bacterium]MCL5040516.1 replicative DNA helicase [Bacillota bacterium]
MSALLERLPPQNLEAEQSVLGSMLIEKEAIARVQETLRAEDFYRDSHRIVYEVISGLFDRGEAVDLITVTEELRRRGHLESIGGVSYLTTLANLVPTAANVEYYARIVEEKSLLRALIKAATEIVARGYAAQEEIDDLLDGAEQLIFQIAQRRNNQSFFSLKELMVEAFTRIEKLYGQKGGVTGVPTGFRELDQLTSGLQPSELIVIAARPSMGKTQLCLNIARHAAIKYRIPVAIFSLEMAREQLALRLLSSEAAVDGQRLRTGFLVDSDWGRLGQAMGRLGDAPVYIDDTPGATVAEVRARSRRMKAEKNLGMVVIDYLQLMQTRSRTENRQQEISEISRSLKALARELKVPVVAASQLSRAVESRPDKRPLLSDLRESGAIEQDADLVAFIYRDDYYNKDSEKRNIAEIIVAKQRNGPVGDVELYFERETGRFHDLDRRHASA